MHRAVRRTGLNFENNYTGTPYFKKKKTKKPFRSKYARLIYSALSYLSATPWLDDRDFPVRIQSFPFKKLIFTYSDKTFTNIVEVLRRTALNRYGSFREIPTFGAIRNTQTVFNYRKKK